MKKLLGFDLESQGLDIETVNITEVGAILIQAYEPGEIPNWKEAGPNKTSVHTVVKQFEQLIWEPGYPPQTKDIIELTGITDEALKSNGVTPKEGIPKVFPLMEEADYIIAHNAPFDKGLLYAVAKRNGLTVPEKPWVCTRTQVPYPERYTCRKLSHMALDHGIKMDNRELHRATSDVQLMLEVLANYSFEQILAFIAEPEVILRIIIPGPWVGKGGDGGVGKAEAAKLGYGWEKPRGYEYQGKIFEKCWVKKVKISKRDEEINKTQLKVVEITGD